MIRKDEVGKYAYKTILPFWAFPHCCLSSAPVVNFIQINAAEIDKQPPLLLK